MGWFWAEQPSPRPSNFRPPPSRSYAEPLRECPMHKNSKPSAPQPVPETPSACPYKPEVTSSSSPTASNSRTSPSYVSKLNPLNYMPSHISNEREATRQSVDLPLEREASSIPRGDGSGTWEYPSPQQMYNAMLRKGYDDTPAEHVEAMVAVHNFLNEGAWRQIKEWEAIFSLGLLKGWKMCANGEENAAKQREWMNRVKGKTRPEELSEPKLLRFMGRPSDLTPKARMQALCAWLDPAKYDGTPPFDRHDWYVERQLPSGHTKEVRYVIDYYSDPSGMEAEPVFYLDVRPAVDGPTAACERMIRWSGDVWYRASGASVREEMRTQKR